MGLYEFSMLRYVPDHKMFDVNKGRKTNLQIFESKDAERIYNNYRNQMRYFSKKRKAEELQTFFNKVVNGTEKQQDIFERITQRMINQLNNANYNKILDTFSNAGLNDVFSIKGGTIKLNKTKMLSDQYEKLTIQLANEMSPLTEKQLKDRGGRLRNAKESFDTLNGSINKLRGDIFETFVKEVFNSVESTFGNFATKTGTDVALEVLSAANSNGRAKVTGGDPKESMTITVTGLDNSEKTTFTIAGSQGKSDVVVEGLYPKNKLRKVGFSAKSYSGSGDKSGFSNYITILSGANILNLIADWPGSSLLKNLALNGLSAKSIFNGQFESMKKIFAIQGLAGLRSEEVMSEFFIINTNEKKDPIVVFSVYDLLFNVVKGNQEEIFEFKGIEPMEYDTEEGRNYKDFIKFIKDTKLSIHSMVTINKLLTLSNKTKG